MTLSTEQVASERAALPVRRLRHIRELDGVRGVAALLVFFHHLCYTSIAPAGWSAPIRALRTIFFYGESGVDLFFVLSGFLITSLLIEARQSRAYYHDFYWKRALRILPLYIVCLIGVLCFIPDTKRYVILSALFLSNFAWLFHIESAGPFWTLAIEEQFYLIWPTVVRRRSVAQLHRWALGVGLTAIGLRLVAAAFGHYNYRLTFFRCDGLAFGAFLACWYAQRNPALPGTAKERRAIASAFFAGILLIALSNLPSGGRLQVQALLAECYQTGVTFFCGSIVAYLISHAGQRNVAWLRSRALTFFGLISYAMYMIHMYVMSVYDTHAAALQPGDNAAYMLRILVVLGVTIVLCVLIRYLIELPALSLRKHVIAKTRS